MDTSWWLALGGVALLAFVAALVDGRRRLGPGLPSGLRRAPGAQPGDVWLARVPGAGERPYLVLAVRADGSVRAVRVVRERDAYVLPAGPGAADIGPARLVCRAGTVDADVWERARHLAE
ncbi:type II toxin-antitoxin system PemK/MazF family toxin [Streptomyces boncukensis]|uniref:Type II toxin-antitoxin system PemK/MazF family toxin n=1 Tax=Streptomyces boncukensis TaxID=2711219 RepID=A0A6G4X190_9ACTN|nr:type II toxin-antitoxin system PemK/MazF family toxin [Streptomyces boncukensis]NGO70892.1 type II toxin-antitoxin system PemK/MazF family toxin [Streptomyces boncukensis]